MAIPFDLAGRTFAVPFVASGEEPAGADSFLWTPGFNGRILAGWASYDTVPTASGTCTSIMEIGTVDAITWTISNSNTANQFFAGTLSTTDTQLYFDTDDVLHLDVASTNKSEFTLNIWLLVQGR